MNLVTVTFDEKTHAIVPIELDGKQLYLAQEGADLLPHRLKRIYQMFIKAAPLYPESNCKKILDGWIPVSERLPENRNSVLCYAVCNDGTAYVKQERLNPAKTAFYVEHDGDEPSEEITYWMNLPVAPKGEE